jgi:hypothetical protein
MKIKETLKAEIPQAVETQLSSNNPPETNQTYHRLLASHQVSVRPMPKSILANV